MQYTGDTRSKPPLSAFFPRPVFEALAQLENRLGKSLYISGGTIRDWLLGRNPADLDFAVDSGAVACCHELLAILGSGAFVMLGTENEEAARVVWRGLALDFSSFRKAAQTIEEELGHRDFSINAMALALSDSQTAVPEKVIDPLNGRADLEKRQIRCCPGAFPDDPLRMLRAYRMQAELGFLPTGECVAEIEKHRQSINSCAAERIRYELDRIMTTSRSAEVFGDMAASGLLWVLFPELKDGLGMAQPEFHHEDVFHHNLLTLRCMERVIAGPPTFFAKHHPVIAQYLKDEQREKILRWAAIFHDLGKPVTRSSGTMPGDRITFYNHDREGRRLFELIAIRLRMSKAEAEAIAGLIEMHMHPFHLTNVRRAGKISRKALLKICKKAGNDLPGLFALAMADSLAGQGVDKPEYMEEELAALFDEVQQAKEEYIEPVLQGERLLTGHDLIERFNLRPGPFFKKILDDLEIARVEGEVGSREEAMLWLSRYLECGTTEEGSSI